MSVESRFKILSYEDDVPQMGKGSLIPNRPRVRSTSIAGLGVLLGIFALLLVGISFIGVQTSSLANVASVPQVSVVDPLTNKSEDLSYGVQILLSEPAFFTDTRDAFIDTELTFIEVDLVKMRLHYFEEGVLRENIQILAKGQVGSQRQTPAGLYKLESKNINYFSTVDQVYQPWSLSFQSNFLIHGLPEIEKGKTVPDYSLSGITLSNEDAERLFGLVKINTPILVFEEQVFEKPFLYEPKIPELATPHYLVADLESNTALASSDLNAKTPIASLTKLMTALVAVENINLDNRVTLLQPSLVESLVPRLGDRNQISMYGLLQLLLTESSNEAAEVIAEQVGRDRFIELMNRRAETLGMTDTNFVDPSGLGADNISTLGDLLRLTRYVYNNHRFIFDITVNQNIPTSPVENEYGELINFNKVEGVDNFIGGKVGETRAAGQTSISMHQLIVKGQSRILTIIILGSEHRGEDVVTLLNYAESHFGG